MLACGVCGPSSEIACILFSVIQRRVHMRNSYTRKLPGSHEEVKTRDVILVIMNDIVVSLGEYAAKLACKTCEVATCEWYVKEIGTQTTSFVVKNRLGTSSK